MDVVAAAPLIGGLTVTGPGSIRDTLEPVLEMTGQRLFARNGSLVGRVQGGLPAASLITDELAQTDAPVLARRRGDSQERPGRLGLRHYDRERDYLAATVTALRPGDGPMAVENLAMVLDPAAARLAAERLLDLRASGHDRVEFALPGNEIALEPGDVIVLDGVAEGPFEIAEIRDGWLRRVTAGPVMRGQAVATTIDRPGRFGAMPVPDVVPVVVAAHLPPLPDDPARSRLVLAAFAHPWPGILRVEDEATGALLTHIHRPAAMGTLSAPLPVGPLSRWDRGGALAVALHGGHLADADPLATLAGTNRLAVETPSGAWEVIGCASAELIAPGLYRLTGLLRGLDGTDAAMVAVSTGARVLILDHRTTTLPVEAHRIGESRSLRVHSGNGIVEVVTVSLGPGPALPLAPVHLGAERQADGSIALHWVRRSRAGADGWGAAEPAVEQRPRPGRCRFSMARCWSGRFRAELPRRPTAWPSRAPILAARRPAFHCQFGRSARSSAQAIRQQGYSMADNRFETCLAHVLRHEGGYVDHPSDPGGATNMGITHKTLARWRQISPWWDLPKSEVQKLTHGEAGQIYRALYWNACRAGELPAGIDLAVFDYAVNSGPDRAIRTLQATLAVVVDGQVGPLTLAAAATANVARIINDICDRRLGFLKALSTFPTFGTGWTKRVATVRAGALAAAPVTSQSNQGDKAMDILSGYKTYIIAAFMLLAGVLQVLGIDLPALDGGSAGSLVLEALAILFLRRGLKGDIEKA